MQNSDPIIENKKESINSLDNNSENKSKSQSHSNFYKENEEDKKSENLDNKREEKITKIKEKAKKVELSIFDFPNNLRTITDEEIDSAPKIVVEVFIFLINIPFTN